MIKNKINNKNANIKELSLSELKNKVKNLTNKRMKGKCKSHYRKERLYIKLIKKYNNILFYAVFNLL